MSKKDFIRNTLSALSRWKIFDNLRRSLVPFALIVLLVGGGTVLNDGLFWSFIVTAILLLPALIIATRDMLHKPKDILLKQHVKDSIKPIPQSTNFILIPDQVRDPGNLGTLLRSAAATGVQAVYLPPETTDAFAPKVLRSGMGAHFRLPIHTMSWEEIKTQTKDMAIFIADMDGTSCWETDLHKPLALVIGGEPEGASDEARRLATQKISIPMAGNVESLNAGVAGSVLMFEVVRQRSKSLVE